ncbi:TonB-dependent receptor [Alkalimonas delamerensis]|uniref:TonB-dependent receptor n=1 Tax=Alkalimonas delamerensis TaxID=265981 RepID=A0ABT9GSI8_9GAMM|nr:TonB-dependent receptor [Alkalimonas delamerensis]MDP4529854.1 TonB-dependent receptor [Alkalimonas delamerensis]
MNRIKPLAASIPLLLGTSMAATGLFHPAFASSQTVLGDEVPTKQTARQQSGPQQTQQVAAASVDEPLERIEVTGSRIRRLDIEGVAPVTVITAEDIEFSGFSSIEDLLQASIFNSGRTVQGNESSWTQGASTINMRGMGENRTLVLVNGQRIPQYPTATGGTTNFVDISTFPTSAIERIEVLSGGASAIYGSDAVGGVVNIILKSRFERNQFDVRHESPQQGGGDKTRMTLTSGFNSSLGQTIVVLQHRNDEILRSGDRNFTSQGGPDGTDGFSSTSAVIQDRSRFYHENSNVVATQEQCQDLFGSYGIWQDEQSTFKCRYDSTRDLHLQSGKKEWNLVVNHHGELGQSWTYNAMVQASDRETLRGNGQKSIGERIYMDQDNPGVYSYNRADFLNPTEFRLFRRLDDYGQRRDYTGLQQTLNTAFGLSGTLNDFDLDLTWAYGKSSFERIGRNQMLADKLLDVVSFDPADSANPAKWYPMDKMTPEQVQTLYAETLTDAGSGLNQFTAVLSGDLMDLPAGPLQFAWSAEWAKEWYFDHKDENTLSGNLLGQGGTQGRGERKRYATAAELAIPLLDDRGGIGKLDASVALRYDYYDDKSEIGGAVTPQAGFTYRPTENILVRLNGGKSFRAPDLHRVYALPTRSFSSTTRHVDPNHPVDEDDRYEQITSGSLGLSEERGRFYNLGIIAQLTENLSVDVDYWRISLRGAVRTGSVSRMLNEPDVFDVSDRYSNCNDVPGVGFIMQQQPGNDYRDILCVKNGAINSAYENSKGVDVKVRYSLSLGDLGDLRLGADVSQSLSKEYQAFADLDKVNALKDWYFPKYRTSAYVQYSKDKWSSYVRWSYIGSTEGVNTWTLTDDEGNSYRESVRSKVAPFSRVNWVTTYSVSRDLRLTLGIQNLFNAMPGTYAEGHPWRNSWPYYSMTSGHNAIGRTFYGEVRYRF